MSAIIETKSAISTGNRLFIKNIARFLLPHPDLNACNDIQYILIHYRRFVRLKKFISQRQMIQNTYIDYIKYKFKYENYEKRRSLVLGKDADSQIDWKTQIAQTYNFIMTAVSHVEGQTTDIDRDILMSKQILKNILTLEYFKIENNEKVSNSDFYDYRVRFKQLEDNEDQRQTRDIDFGEFDKIVMYLNETIGTRL
ncbi:similar to Saccharomyces cerevisiae YLL033W IRC19 Putative protein of unknown function [Maudiozyma saulgeensis]|uniref:Increased recombination centers protein 19 n=1 Tax=Maudiozyma saulgeensis TaxID=1789683 RepID=A0A1X7RBU4_9SACH|nr:similar to Saccharomyces cerevisiae YLL033W IRC19 Putative protein of unknown function [Kazachstania saulgeensis]